VEQEAPCHGTFKKIMHSKMFFFFVIHTFIKLICHLSFINVFQIMMIQLKPEEPVEEAEAMVPEAAYNSLSEKYDQLNTEYVNIRKDFYKLKEENERLKEELQKSRFSFSTIKNNAAQFLFLTGLTSLIFSWLMSKIKDSVHKQQVSCWKIIY